MRDQFQLPAGVLYFNGNSLGPLTHAAAATVARVVNDQWGQQVVAAWNESGWIDMPKRLGDQLSTILGAKPGQTLVCDSTSVNIFKLLMAALARHPDRRRVLIEDDGFPTDGYIAQGVQGFFPQLDIQFVAADDMSDAFDSSVAAALINHVNYRSGARVDMARTQARALQLDVPVIWDLAHSAGAVPLNLDADGVEYAVGCSYKFLNGGPGAPAFLYVAEHCLPQASVAIAGWFGHARPFQFDAHYAPAAGIEKFQAGTPNIISMSAFEASLSVFDALNMSDVWAQSCQLFDRFVQQLSAYEALSDFQLLTPRQPQDRGSQISLTHPQAYAICQALAEHGVIVDYREPAVIRFGLTPLYTRLEDVDAAIELLNTIMRDGLWQQPQFQIRKAVT